MVDVAGDERDARISEIFYHFETLTSLSSGRTVGRKIGVVQEIVLKKYLDADDDIRRRMYLEQKLTGISGAAHKVEFSFHPLLSTATLSVSDEIPGTKGLSIAAVAAASETARVALPESKKTGILAPGRISGGAKVEIQKHLDALGVDIRVRSIDDEGVTVDVLDRTRLLASLESKRVGAQRFSSSDKLGSGIQTIEKAKQASLVAVDLDLKHNGSVKPLQSVNAPKSLLSFVALGNGVHWTEKDKAVLGTFVDFTFLVKDDAIIRYADFVQELAGEDIDFMDYFMAYFQGMTKQGEDEFEVVDDDFAIIVPESESRSLRQILREHLVAANAAP
jgi:hypothetical protein